MEVRQISFYLLVLVPDFDLYFFIKLFSIKIIFHWKQIISLYYYFYWNYFPLDNLRGDGKICRVKQPSAAELLFGVCRADKYKFVYFMSMFGKNV